VVAEPAFQQISTSGGIEPTPESSPQQFRRSLADDVMFWAPLVKALGVKTD